MKKKSITLIVISIFAFLLVVFAVLLGIYFSSLRPIETDSKENISFTVNKGDTTSTIIKNLKEIGLIRNELTMKIYVKMNPGNLQAGTYIFTKNMSVEEIYDTILKGKVTRDTIWVTFVEGKRLTYITDVIAKNFKFTKEEIEEKLENRDYLSKLISKYDFLTEEILNEKIYHPLEGYLFADTYEFMSDITLEGIIEKMLNNTASKLSAYSEAIEQSGKSIHEIMTLASIVELEGARSDDRKGVAGVFINRLKSGWSLGSDVTTYYAVGKDFSVDLTKQDLNSCNSYNTRGTCVQGLPVGPIATPSYSSIKATLEPKKHDYYFFVADKNGKTYFSKTGTEHDNTVRRLKEQGLWFTY